MEPCRGRYTCEGTAGLIIKVRARVLEGGVIGG